MLFWHLPPALISLVDLLHPPHGIIIITPVSRSAVGPCVLHSQESQLFIWSPKPENNVVDPDGICGSQPQFTEAPPHNTQGSKDLLLIFLCWTLQDTLRCSLTDYIINTKWMFIMCGVSFQLVL